MSDDSETEFCDDELKLAVCRCWASECASALLRARVAASLQDTESLRLNATALLQRRRVSWVIWPTAAAALILISAGFFLHLRPFVQSPATRLATALPASLEDDLIQTHDHCCSKPDHQQVKAPKDNDAEIIRCLHALVSQPVVMYRPADASWVFLGASVCPVGSASSEHLVFTRGSAALSIFTLPSESLKGATNGSQYWDTVKNHRIVGCVKDAVVICLVSTDPTGESGAPGIEQMKQMESEMNPSIARTYPRHTAGSAVARLSVNPSFRHAAVPQLSLARFNSGEVLLTELLRPIP